MHDSNPAHPGLAQVSTDAGHRTVRRATATDAAAVRELTRAAHAKWVPLLGREPRPMTADHDAAVRDHLVDLLGVDGETVALIEMAPAADHLLIVNFAVAPAHQGRGHGRALMAHAEEVARSLRLGEVRLYTNGLFAENLRLYDRLGYRVDREEEHPQLGVAVYMSKRLGTADPAPQPTGTPAEDTTMSLRVGIVGISGFGGGEVMRLIASHPSFELVYAAGEGSADSRLVDRFPGVPTKLAGLVIEKWDPAALPKLDVLFASLPTGASAEALARVPTDVKIVDVGGDHRYVEGWTYGLADVWPAQIRGQTRVANPGCFPAATLNALAPACCMEVACGPAE